MPSLGHRYFMSNQFTQAVQSVKTLNRIKDIIEPEATLKLVNENLAPYVIFWDSEKKEFFLETLTEEVKES